MARRSLKPQLNQIRTWVRQGRTDAWIAHQLEVTVQQIQSFKREQELEPDRDENGQFSEDVDLRAEDDAAIAAELEAEAERKRAEEAGRGGGAGGGGPARGGGDDVGGAGADAAGAEGAPRGGGGGAPAAAGRPAAAEAAERGETPSD